jgi:predicted nucleic acid-binding protein
MKLFFDTSALVKFFYEEDGFDIVTDLITSKRNEIWLLELVRVEFYCALYRRFRNNEISEDQLNIAISGFNEIME